ncbi:hypothetical protein CDAR_400941 [Caerostris darwini]|uniref:Uncharacterized protein n=1 Tax=Caerostris darwini TaxID=1538125 RepID=A0AAV4TJD0_9ARAC|nr:hypothetical protein CDAR_400941 [Caerostris darwini]
MHCKEDNTWFYIVLRSLFVVKPVTLRGWASHPPSGSPHRRPLLLSLSNAQHVPLETAGRELKVWLGNTEQERRETIVLPWQVLIAESHAALTDSFTESVYFATFSDCIALRMDGPVFHSTDFMALGYVSANSLHIERFKFDGMNSYI